MPLLANSSHLLCTSVYSSPCWRDYVCQAEHKALLRGLLSNAHLLRNYQLPTCLMAGLVSGPGNLSVLENHCRSNSEVHPSHRAVNAAHQSQPWTASPCLQYQLNYVWPDHFLISS